MPNKAKPLTRVHRRSEQDKIVRLPGTRRYVRANSPTIVHGSQGSRTENIRGRFSKPKANPIINDKRELARALGRRSKATARIASLKKF